ncbi:MAG: alpha/beta fold hydrolase [Myxococcales bacterium]|nr:alpha/beta fold hydrolase [Myxococcales bacterium]
MSLQTQFLVRPEGRIAFDLRGPSNGPLVVAVPSLGDVRAEYRFLAPRLAEQGFRVATLDVRGHGESDVGFSDFTSAAVGSDVVALIDHLGARKAQVIGTSMAAAGAVWAAAERPETIERIVLVGPFVRAIPAPAWLRIAMKLLFMRPWGPSAWGLYYKSLYPTSPPADLATYRAELVANLRQPGRLEALHAMLADDKSACEARIPEVRARTLVMMGSRDPDFPKPEAEARLVAERLSAEHVMIEGAGHYPHAEMPDLVAPRIASFLAPVQEEVAHP